MRPGYWRFQNTGYPKHLKLRGNAEHVHSWGLGERTKTQQQRQNILNTSKVHKN